MIREDAIEVRALFRRVFAFDLRTGILLLVVFGLVRVLLVVQGTIVGSYQAVSIVFVAMAALPWIMLTRAGRVRIGLVRPARWRWMLPAALAGAALALVIAVIGATLWGRGVENPFAYIARTYPNVSADLSDSDRVIYFAIFAMIGVLFSPIGEELLYRGVAHESIASRLGNRNAALIDAGAFSLVHLSHFGFVYLGGVWSLLPLPALFWITSMFVASLVFYAFRALTGSITGAIVAHAGFNLMMNAVIFFWILR